MKRKHIIIFSIFITFILIIKIIYTNKSKTEGKRAFDYTKIQETVYEEKKIGPNAKLVLKKFYMKCSHTKEDEEQNVDNLVNLTKEELQQKYPDWDIEKFSEEEIILIKNIDDFCNEHYVLKNNNGYVTVFKIDSGMNEEIYLSTDIAIVYLPEIDQLNLEKGIYVFSNEKLIEILQDFE